MRRNERQTIQYLRRNVRPIPLTVAAAMLFALLAGCATLEARKRLQEYDGYFSPMIGKARQADIKQKFGEPIRKDKMGTTELWYYHIPGRDRGGPQASGGFEGGYAVGADSEVYDDLTIEFDAKGYLKSWRGYIQR